MCIKSLSELSSFLLSRWNIFFWIMFFASNLATFTPSYTTCFRIHYAEYIGCSLCRLIRLLSMWCRAAAFFSSSIHGVHCAGLADFSVRGAARRHFSLNLSLDRRLGGPQSQSGPYLDLKSDPSVVQPVASCYTDCAIAAPRLRLITTLLLKLPSFIYRYSKYDFSN
jgi:hypothetical protein